MNRVLLPLPAQRPLAEAIAPSVGARVGRFEWRRFPDGESLVTLDESLAGCEVAIVASLDDPDTKALALRFAADTAREFGARRVGLVAPYLAYMRQDARFRPGEAVSAPLFARFLAQGFDWLLTVDPHLHRYDTLSAIYPIPTRCVEAAPRLAGWIAREVPDAVLVGPDSESAQWVGRIAALAGLPWQVLHKTRRGDREVEISLPDLAGARGRTPVVVDDIVAPGHTAIETVRRLRALGFDEVVCVAIHGVFAEQADVRLREAGATRIVTTDSIPHATSGITLAPLIAAELPAMFAPAAVEAVP